MGRRFAELAFTPLVKRHQQAHGSRQMYERVERSGDTGDRLGPDEQEFIGQRDGFYMASVSETGWPYMQHRGGQKGFLRVLDPQTIAFADLRGNKQYISLGNLEHDNRVALFLMDYPRQARLKILGRARILESGTGENGVGEGDAEAARMLETLRVPGEKTPAERAILIDVEAFDWNCQQHITPRYSEEELAQALAPMRKRLEFLEAENKRLRTAAGNVESGSPSPVSSAKSPAPAQ
jgi:predicted pyridoxine 5'-phosphate oxidase superfamily flavin-nucleotide-binding protein